MISTEFLRFLIIAVIWPTSSVVQQLINKDKLDLKKSLRFFVFGTFFVAPSLYAWVKVIFKKIHNC